jgi:hypothetical protein
LACPFVQCAILDSGQTDPSEPEFGNCVYQ